MPGQERKMSWMEKTRIMDDAEIRINGIEALNRALGPAAALRFLTLFHREPTDYVEISRRLYEGQTIDEIFERARQHWKK
jgi:hypothetical protein